jgi:LEA14-like dessication related protein
MFIAAFLGPILYGYAQYGFDIQRYVSPIYNPPEINFASNIVGYNYTGDRFTTIMSIDNLGEVDVSIKYLHASLYGEDGRNITRIYLEKPVDVPSMSSANMEMYINLDRENLKRIIRYFSEMGTMRLIIRGTLGIEVFSSRVEYPLEIPIHIPNEFIDNYMRGVSLEILDAMSTPEGIIFTISITNPTMFQWSVTDIHLELHTEEDILIGHLTLIHPISLPPESRAEARLILALVPDALPLLIDYYSGSDLMTFKLMGEVTLEYMGVRHMISVSDTVDLHRNIFLGIGL